MLAAAVLVFLDRKFSKRMQKKSEDSKPPKITLKVVRSLGIVMLMVFIIITFAVAIEGSIIINANDMLHERVGFTNTQAGPIAMMTLLVNCKIHNEYRYYQSPLGVRQGEGRT